MSDFEELTKEEVIKKFISAEFNRFIEYYERAGDLNVDSDRRERGERSDRPERGERSERPERGERRERNDVGKTRFFVSLGKRDGLNPGGLLRIICDQTGLTSSNIGKIDILPSFSFFEADDAHAQNILNQVNGSEYEGNKISVEITKKKADSRPRTGEGGGFSGSRDRGFGGGGGGRSDRSYGGGRSGGGDKGGFRGGDRKSDGGRSGGFKGNSDRSYKKSSY